MSNTPYVLVVGGSDAGKSNFIFRLWLAIRDRSCCLQADGVPADIDYLETGARKLLGGEYSPHTSQTVHNQNIIRVKNGTGTSDFHGELVVPDYSGEEWQRIYQKREWPEQWENYIEHHCSSLLFIRVDSDQHVSPLDWITCERTFGTTSGVPSSGGAGQQRETPTQVVLVDWLQCIRSAYTDIIDGSYRPRVGIVITAWDLVPQDQQALGPEKYLRENYPMLFEFITTNKDRYVFELFGASIAGGDLQTDAEFRKGYLEGDPYKAGYVVHMLNSSIEKSSDLTLPVAWAMGLIERSGGEVKSVR